MKNRRPPPQSSSIGRWQWAFRWRKPRRKVIYTCLFGQSEPFNDFRYESDNSIDCVCFTDDPSLSASFWQVQVMPPCLLDPARASKRIKHLPHKYLADYDESLYLDNTVRLRVPPAAMFAKLERAAVFKCFRHPYRQCVYDEAAEVIKQQLDDPVRVRRQMAYYENVLRYPKMNGLVATSSLLRRHNDPALVAVSEEWHQQVLLHSVRDQLSFNVVAWHHDFAISYYDLALTDLVERPPLKGPRLPRDFDDVRYLRLHPDVKAAGIDPRRH
jgi:hypothetical protein